LERRTHDEKIRLAIFGGHPSISIHCWYRRHRIPDGTCHPQRAHGSGKHQVFSRASPASMVEHPFLLICRFRHIFDNTHPSVLEVDQGKIPTGFQGKME
jgi:hypothetical protein